MRVSGVMASSSPATPQLASPRLVLPKEIPDDAGRNGLDDLLRDFEMEVIRMRGPRTLASVLAVAASLMCAATVVAAPSSDNNKNALLIEFDCGSTSFSGATIFQNASVVLHVADDSATTAKLVTLSSYTDAARTEGEQLWFTTPGFDHNGADTLSCEWWNALYPDLYWRGDISVRPAG